MRPLTTSGVINLNKPAGTTSFQMVALVRRLSRIKKVGHAGTLDPDATGVLPILIGRATKLASHLTESRKTYRAEIVFGRSTTTYDASGETTSQSDPSELTLHSIESILESFRGQLQQIPPMYSAIKHQGKPLYALARSGIEIERKPRDVTIYRIDVLEWNNPRLKLEIECSKGTYIRSLAHDLGQESGFGAHMSTLVRTQNGPFHIEDAITMTDLEAAFAEQPWSTFIQPMDTLLSHLPAITVNETNATHITCGRTFPTADCKPQSSSDTLYRAYSPSGAFIALIRRDTETELWRPEKVFVDCGSLS